MIPACKNFYEVIKEQRNKETKKEKMSNSYEENTHTHTHIYVYIYHTQINTNSNNLYVSVCMCVVVVNCFSFRTYHASKDTIPFIFIHNQRCLLSSQLQ